MINDLRVCFLGDSFVAGIGDPDHLGWTGRLSTRTHRNGQALSAYNLGVRRQTSTEVLSRWQDECAPRLPPECDARLVVSFGVNDTTLDGGRQRVDTPGSAENLARLLNGARELSWPVLVVGPPPVADTEHNARTAVLDQHLHRVCLAAGTPYVTTLGPLLSTPVWMEQVAAGDGAHPGAQGYAALAHVAWPTWSAWLTPSRPR